ncbi:MAG TPA: type II toxin-antitoxin system HipA family toxin [Terriglobales bacterium]|nr:type II toxin-antitoxin system HipA family toxin [Terriglobales bacterium]
MIKIWTDAAEAGALDRWQDPRLTEGRGKGSTFVYTPGVAGERTVSKTMPVRLESWDQSFGLAPIFEMNLPEGALRERLRMDFAKAMGRFDDIDLLTIVGRSQIGRIRYTGMQETLAEELPFASVDDILANTSGEDLYRFLLDRYAATSGISGVQPKILVRDSGAAQRLPSVQGATHVVKFWEANAYPQLAANEYFCLRAAERCGLQVPPYRLSEDGLALVVDRFDLRAGGAYRGFEDFCVLNGRSTADKYRGSYETAVMKRLGQFCDPRWLTGDMERLFTLIALNCALRNGDAHLKNFGIVYDDVLGEARLAPVYDVVTTAVYLPRDRMALTLDGTTEWPEGKTLRRFGEVRLGAAPKRISGVLEHVADALSAVAPEVRAYGREHPAFAPIGEAMLEQWEAGQRLSLG